MPSALCSISHWVQILDTAVRDQPLSQPPAAGACHLGQLCGDVLEEPQQPLCSLGSYARVMQEAQTTSLAGGSARPPPKRWGMATPLIQLPVLWDTGAAARVAPA